MCIIRLGSLFLGVRPSETSPRVQRDGGYENVPFSGAALIVCLSHLEARPDSTLSWLSAHVLQASVCGLSGDCAQSLGTSQNFLEVGFALSTAGGKEFAAAPIWLTFTDHKTILTLRAGEGRK